ncbi:MAG: ribonuclease III [Chloroflexaceae bacterium]|nr:ribonuclease III [Chloroflexaceae bacterium]
MSRQLPPIAGAKLLRQALTHRSYANENPSEGDDNERLEFLGDAVLGFLIGELLFRRYPHVSEAELTRLRSKLVDEKQLCEFGRQLGLGEQIYLGKGAEKDGGRDSPAILSDAFEAMIGAYFLESGIEGVRVYIETLYATVDCLQQEVAAEELIDPKNRFQQWALAHKGENPKYRIIAEAGPDHAKEFTAQVCVQGIAYGTGMGRRKQEAQKHAAEAALKYVGLA